MSHPGKAGEILKLRIYFMFIVLGLTCIIFASLFWSLSRSYDNTLKIIRFQALDSFEKDVFYRRWNASLGGVYGLVTEHLTPNPYLDLEGRDIPAGDGKILTKVNPAYMTRLVHEIQNREKGVIGHITSLRPIRPANAADAWETEALKRFEKGEEEFSSLEAIDGEEYLRFMKPLMVEESCLKCHAKQGYTTGQVRGGISVSIPVKGSFAIMEDEQNDSIVIHVAFFAMFLVGLSLSYLNIYRGIIYRCKSREEIEQVCEKLEYANKELNAFTYSVSHDLRSPLRHIRGFSEILHVNTEDVISDEDKELFSKIMDSTERMDQLIEDFLQLAKMENKDIRIEELDLADISRSIFKKLTSAEPERNVKLKIVDKLPILADRTLMAIAMENLIGNAWKFTFMREEAVIEVGSFLDKGSQQVCYVKDNGDGFDEAQKDKLFVPFQRLHSQKEFRGSGVGLATVGKIISRHKGDIWAESGEDEGATFFFTLSAKKTT